MDSTKDQIHHSTSTEGESSVRNSFFQMGSWRGKVIHLCTNMDIQPFCRIKISFPEKGVEVKYIDGELKEKSGDGIVQEIKWVKVDEYRYCKLCLSALVKNRTKDQYSISENMNIVFRLSPAQKREYELLKARGSIYVYGWRRRGVFEQLEAKGLCHSDGSRNWFHLNAM